MGDLGGSEIQSFYPKGAWMVSMQPETQSKISTPLLTRKRRRNDLGAESSAGGNRGTCGRCCHTEAPKLCCCLSMQPETRVLSFVLLQLFGPREPERLLQTLLRSLLLRKW